MFSLPGRPSRRLLILLVSVAASALGGCLGASGTDPGGTADHRVSGAAFPGEEEAEPGPYFHFVAGVEPLHGRFLPDGGAMGVVWDVADGAPIIDGEVVAWCRFHEYPLPVAQLTAQTDDLGRFEIHGTLFFAGCDEVTFHVEAPGYVPEAELSTGPLGKEAQYLVKIPLRAV